MERIFRVDLYPHEFLSLTAHMTVEQRGLFITVCCLIYAHRGPIKNDPAWIGRMANCSTRMAGTLIGQLCEQGDLIIEGGLIRQKRSEKELAKKRAHLDGSSRGGRTSAENRRESNKNNDVTSRPEDRSLPTSSPSPSPSIASLEGKPSKKASPTVKAASRISYNFETRKFEGITDADIALWQETYPAVDVVYELKRIAAWCRANPKKKKKDYARFINNWLSKTQDEGGSKNGATGNGRGHRPAEGGIRQSTETGHRGAGGSATKQERLARVAQRIGEKRGYFGTDPQGAIIEGEPQRAAGTDDDAVAVLPNAETVRPGT